MKKINISKFSFYIGMLGAILFIISVTVNFYEVGGMSSPANQNLFNVILRFALPSIYILILILGLNLLKYSWGLGVVILLSGLFYAVTFLMTALLFNDFSGSSIPMIIGGLAVTISSVKFLLDYKNQ